MADVKTGSSTGKYRQMKYDLIICDDVDNFIVTPERREALKKWYEVNSKHLPILPTDTTVLTAEQIDNLLNTEK